MSQFFGKKVGHETTGDKVATIATGMTGAATERGTPPEAFRLVRRGADNVAAR
jgi:hypothetical protein